MNLTFHTEQIYQVFEQTNSSSLIESAKKEIFRLLNLRFPGRDIYLDEVDILSIKSVIFDDGSLGCPRDGYQYMQARQHGYTLTCRYEDMNYHLHTTYGETFVSNELKLYGDYSNYAFAQVKQMLFVALGKEIRRNEMIVDHYSEKDGYYSFDIIYEGHSYSFCFNEFGEPGLISM